MSDQRPYPWLGCAIPPIFYYSPCGHLVDCSDPTYDLEAKRAQLRKADFRRCLTEAIATGCHGRRSSCQQVDVICEAVDAVAIVPRPQNIWRAQWTFDNYEAWLLEDDDS